MNVLLGDISSYKAIVVAKYLYKNYSNCKIYSFDSRSFTNKFRTKYSIKHFVIKEDDIDGYLEVINKNNIDVFIPVINNVLDRLWCNKNHFGSTLNYLGDYDTYKVLNDKLILHDLAEKLEIKVPKKYTTVTEAEFPFVMKPTNLSSAQGVLYVNEQHDIPTNFGFDNFIIQQFVAGEGVGYSFYAKEGQIENGYGHKRLAEYPVSGGSSTYRTNYNDKRMLEVSSKIVSHLNYTGFAMFEFKLTSNNELYLLEVNPRIWGSVHQGLANNVNYFEKILGSGSFQNNGSSKNTYIGPLIYLSFLRYLFVGNMKPLMFFLRNFFNNVPDVSIINDPKAYLSTILRKLNI